MPELHDIGDYNPFHDHVTLEPTDDNPFALKGDVGAAQRQLASSEAQRRSALSQFTSRWTLPGRVAAGVTTATPGVMTEEDAYRLNQLENEAQNWGPAQAAAMLGGGVSGAERGALGTAGGGIKVYHGSPHDFEKFDVGKIGTGEGAQVYGHGLYFAENPAVAQTYKGASGGGKMYEVGINADPEHFLDWDKPLSQQHPKVQPIIAEAVQKEAYNRALAATSKQRADELWAMVKDPSKAPAGFAQDLLKKPEIVEKLRQAGIPGIKYLDEGSRQSPFTVAAQYGAEGVDHYVVSGPGNIAHARFPTREEANAFADKKNAEGQTLNYVVFHHDIIDILKKYGLAGLVAGGAAHFKTQPVSHDPFLQQE